MDDRKCADFLMANRYYDSDREYRIFSNHEVFASVIELRYGQGYMENVDVLEKLVSIDSANVELMLKLLGKYLKNNRYEAIKNAPNKLTGFYKKNPKEYLTLTGFDERSASFSQYVRANKKNVFELGSECVNKEFFDAYMGFVKENGLLKKYVVDGDSAIPFGIRTLLNKDFTMYISKFVVDTARRDGVMLKAAVRLARVYMNQGFVMCPDSDFEKLIADALSEAVPTGDSDLDALKQTVKNNNQYFESKYGKDKTPVIAAFRSLVIRALDATDKGKVLNSFGFNDEGKWSFLFT